MTLGPKVVSFAFGLRAIERTLERFLAALIIIQ